VKQLPWIPPVLAFAYAIAVVIAAWRAPAKDFQAFTGHRVARVEPGGAAERAGLREGDVIAEIDGVPVASTLDYAARVLQRAPGELVVLDVTRDGRPQQIAVTLGSSPPPWSALVATLLAAIMLVLGLVARIGRPDDPVATRFYRASLVYAVVYVGALSWPHLVVHPVLGIAFLAALFAGPKLALDLALALTESSRAARRWSRAMGAVALALGLGCAIALVVAIAGYRTGGDAALRWVVVAVAVQIGALPIYAAIALAFQIRAHRVAHGARRAQLRWLVFGQAVGAIPVIAALPFAALDLDRFLVAGYEPFVVAIAAIWFISCGIAVLQVRLADVDALIESSLGYTITTGAAVVVYIGVVLAAGELTEWLVGDAGVWPHVVAAIAAAATFGPLRARVGGWLDRRFFRDRAHYVEALRRAGESLARLREPAELARVAVEQVVAAVHAEAGALYIAGDAAGESAAGESAGGWSIAHAIGDPGTPAAPRDGIAVPVGSRPSGAMLVLGPRRNGDLYSTHDRDLLAAVASQLAAALANAGAYGTITELSRTLEAQNVEIRGLRDRLEDENRLLRARVDAAIEGATLVGESHAIRELRRTAELVAKSDASVLILGESGTGKGLLARLLHAWSPRMAGPFLRVDCGSIAAGVFESELFGHERGAFTGATRLRRGPIELAHGGTLVLDEIGELPLELQPKLLRVLEDHAVLRVGATEPVAVDVRVIAATNRELEAMVARGAFREDLYFRLRVVELVAPPLRNRLADLAALCEQLVPRVARRCGRTAKLVAADALDRMAAYAWPGNVRELENMLERALVLGDADAITAADLGLPESAAPPELDLVAVAPSVAAAPHGEVMEDIERRRLTNALRDAAGNQSNAARALGMPRTTFINKLRRYGLL
jgi:transcriptional regulator with GAF, ATPase, and Fis domain